MAFDNYDTIIRRDQLVQFIQLGKMKEYAVHGNGIEDLAMAYDATTQEFKWVTSKNGMEQVIDYKISLDQEQYVQAGNPVFKELNELRKALDTNAKGKLLTVEFFKGEDPATVTTAPAEEMEVGLQFSSYGGSSDNPLTIGYTLTSIGTPKIGVATFVHEEEKVTVTFEEKKPSEV